MSVDFWRGFALLTIFVNHVPGNAFEGFTHRNFGFSDATEVFVFLAGVAAAFAYLPAMDRWQQTSFRIVLRAFQLYTTHIVLIVACGAIIAYSVLATSDTRLLEALHLDILFNDTVPGLVGLATLRMQPAYLNILPLYIVLLLMAPPALLIARARPLAAAAASAALYLAAQAVPLRLPNYPSDGTWFFNPFAWQLMFVAGILVGRVILQGGELRHRRALTLLAAGYLLVSLVWVRAGFFPWWDLSPLPHFIWDFSKSDLHLPRVLHAVALAYVVTQLPVEGWLRGSRFGRAVTVLGRHSLPVFCAGTIFAIFAQVVRTQTEGSLAADAILIGGGMLIQLTLAGVLEWHRNAQAQTAALRGVAR